MKKVGGRKKCTVSHRQQQLSVALSWCMASHSAWRCQKTCWGYDKGTLSPTTRLTDKQVEEHWTQDGSLGNTTHDHTPPTRRAADPNLWLPPSSQLFIYSIIQPSNPYFSKLEIRMWCKTVSKALHSSGRLYQLPFLCPSMPLLHHQRPPD